MKTLLLTACFFLLFLFAPSVALANENFSLSSDITYSVEDKEMTHVVINMSLTNKTSQYYATQNAIRVGFTNIENVRASDPDGSITPDVVKDEKGYTITVKFNKQVVGINKTLPFTIAFDTPNIVQQQGTIYEVDIPGIAKQNDYETFNVHVRVPSYFGPPQYIKPDVGTKTLDFTKEQLGNGGISIAFGQNQVYAFTLKYHINNTHVFPIKTEIALPPNTNYQEVAIEKIDPPPLQVTQDADGNWLAQYSLLPSDEKDIVVTGKVKVNLLPKQQIESEEQLKKYLLPQKYWEVENPEIVALAKKLQTPKAIYDYVREKLTYDLSRVNEKKGRLGAIQTLQNPTSAVCLEFTDLFITLARAAGIPAREVDGFGYTHNAIQRPLSFQDDVLHAWPQYYDREKQTWIMVDPTWGNTTNGIDYFNVLDYSHITFVLKGTDSTYPVPAGGYKVPGKEDRKDVNITPITESTFPSPQARATISVDKKQFAGFPVSGMVRIVNPGGVAYPSHQIMVTSNALQPAKQDMNLPPILPFGYVDIPVSFRNTEIFTHKDATISVQIGGATISETVRIVPFYKALFEPPLLPWTILGGVFLASISIIIYILTTRPRNISVS